MKKTYQTHSDEIDFIYLLQVIWEGKLKIIAITIILFLAAYGYHTILVPKNYLARTEVKPMSSSEVDKYLNLNTSILNLLKSDDINQFDESSSIDDNKETNYGEDRKNNSSIGLFSISQSSLLNRYLEVLEYRSLFEQAIRKFNLIDINNYADEKEYNDAVVMFASSVQILSPAQKKSKGEEEITYGVIQFIYHDKNKWSQVLNYVNEAANQLVQQDLKKMYENLLSIPRNEQLNQIEDLTTKIENLIDDYDRNSNDRLLFLQEQAEIARTLGVAKNTLETHVFIAQNTMLTSVETKTPLYLRGYEAIEKEMNLIKSRDEITKKAFVPGLYKLEKQKRTLIQNKSVIRASSILENTPLSDNNFKAALVNVTATKFRILKNNRLLYLSVIFGLIIGIFYTLISDAFRYRNKLKKN